MYEPFPPEVDRRVTWQSVTAGVLLNLAVLALLVAVSYPVATGAVFAIGTGLYAARRVLRRVDYERTLEFCRGGVCLRLELAVG